MERYLKPFCKLSIAPRGCVSHLAETALCSKVVSRSIIGSCCRFKIFVFTTSQHVFPFARKVSWPPHNYQDYCPYYEQRVYGVTNTPSCPTGGGPEIVAGVE